MGKSYIVTVNDHDYASDNVDIAFALMAQGAEMSIKIAKHIPAAPRKAYPLGPNNGFLPELEN